MQLIKVHELAPPTCVLLLSKNFDPSLFFMLLLLCPCPCPNPTSHDIFVLISPPLSSISIKDMPLLIQRVALRGRWLTLKYCIFMDTTICVVMIPIGGAPPLCHSMGHPLDKLELLLVRELSSLDDHLKLRITCGTTITTVLYD